MDAPSALRGKLAIKDVKIEECAEVMELVDGQEFVLEPLYKLWGYSQTGDIALRHGVIEKLRSAQSQLRRIPGCEKWKLKIWDGFRTIETQGKIYQAYLNDLKARYPDWDDEKIKQAVEIFVSSPQRGKDFPPPHNTGGAVDLTLVDEYGQEVPMGTAFDEFNDRANTDHFENGEDNIKNFDRLVWRFSTPECLMFRTNRRLLQRIMKEAGFVNYDKEWWHFSYGDQAWAAETSSDKAIYGSIELAAMAA